MNNKIYNSLTAPIMLIGMPWSSTIFLLFSFAVIYVLTKNSMLIALTYLVIGYLLGLYLTKVDKDWWEILRYNLYVFGGSFYIEECYVA